MSATESNSSYTPGIKTRVDYYYAHGEELGMFEYYPEISWPESWATNASNTGTEHFVSSIWLTFGI
jgi:hypothetical protein